MGFLDELKKLTRPYDEDDEFMDEAEVVDEPAPEKRSNPFAGFSSAPASEPAPERPAAPRPQRQGKVVNLGANSGNQLQVVLVKPERFETAAEIADHLRDKRAVVMNMETTPKDVARRLIDFLSGVAYAQDGKIKKIAANTYIITPYNVSLMGDLMDELESSGVYF
ncbi:MAG: cell division protein SepF [Oscillospiraceae bacterium]